MRHHKAYHADFFQAPLHNAPHCLGVSETSTQSCSLACAGSARATCCRCAQCTRTWLAGVDSLEIINIPAPQKIAHEFALHVSTQKLVIISQSIESCRAFVSLRYGKGQWQTVHAYDVSQTMHDIRLDTTLAFSLASSAVMPWASASFFALW